METYRDSKIKIVIPKETVSMYAKEFHNVFTDTEMELRTVYVNPVNHSVIPPGFDFDEYIKKAVRGEQQQEKHEEFLHMVYEPYERFGSEPNGFWWGDDTSERPKNLIETYSKRFTECFGEKGRNLVTAPSAIREIVERIYVNGRSYSEHYGMNQVNNMNFLEVVCEIIENMSRGEIAKSYSSMEQEHIIVTYRPLGKNYVNVYLPTSAFADFSSKKIGIA